MTLTHQQLKQAVEAIAEIGAEGYTGQNQVLLEVAAAVLAIRTGVEPNASEHVRFSKKNGQWTVSFPEFTVDEIEDLNTLLSALDLESFPQGTGIGGEEREPRTLKLIIPA